MCPVWFLFVQYAKPWLYSDIKSCSSQSVHASLPGMILLYLTTPYLHRKCFYMRYHHVCKVHALL